MLPRLGLYIDKLASADEPTAAPGTKDTREVQSLGKSIRIKENATDSPV